MRYKKIQVQTRTILYYTYHKSVPKQTKRTHQYQQQKMKIISLTIIIIQKTPLKNSMEDQHIRKRKYSKISIKKREKLVEMIAKFNFTIEKAAKKNGIKASTARRIYNKYKETGLFPMKQFRKNKNRSQRREKRERNSVDPLKSEAQKSEQGAYHQNQSLGLYPINFPLADPSYSYFNYVWMSAQGIMYQYCLV